MFPVELKKNKLIKFDINILQRLENSCLVGIDEVGRGALAGPVISCAFSWKQNIDWVKFKKQYPLLKKINDSKQVKNNYRQELYDLFFALGEVGIGYASVLEIEKFNILNATFLAMKRAYDNLFESKKHTTKPYILIDGNKFNPYLNCRQLPIIGGDAKSSVIASASIIAKVYRDNLMQRISQAESFKCYSWERNVGYGTKRHCLAIKEKGISSLHRKLFTRKVLSLA